MGYEPISGRGAPNFNIWEPAIQAHNETYATDTVTTTPTKAPLQPIHDTISKSQESGNTSASPQLDLPLVDKQPDLASLKKLQSLGKVTLPSGRKIPLEYLLQYILYTLIEDYSKEAVSKKSWLDAERTYQETKEQERAACEDTRIKDIHNLSVATKARSTISALSLFVASLQSITAAAVNPLFAAGGLIVSGLMALDRLLDDAVSKKVANFLSRGTQETETLWLDRIHLFTSLASIGLSVGLSGMIAVNVAQKGAELGATGVEAYLKERSNKTRAHLLEIDQACDASEEQIQKIMKAIEQLATIINQYITLKFEIEQKRSDLIRSFCQNMA